MHIVFSIAFLYLASLKNTEESATPCYGDYSDQGRASTYAI